MQTSIVSFLMKLSDHESPEYFSYTVMHYTFKNKYSERVVLQITTKSQVINTFIDFV